MPGKKKKKKVNKDTLKYKMKKAKWLAKLEMWEAINAAQAEGREVGPEEAGALYE